jgi:hypothetical protein
VKVRQFLVNEPSFQISGNLITTSNSGGITSTTGNDLVGYVEIEGNRIDFGKSDDVEEPDA